MRIVQIQFYQNIQKNFNSNFSCSVNLSIEVDEGSILKKYLDQARGLSVEERGKLLENDKSFTDAHQEVAVEGQTDANSGQPVNHHFVTFINFNNQLYELDGRKSFPIPHGATKDESFLQVIISCYFFFSEFLKQNQ